MTYADPMKIPATLAAAAFAASILTTTVAAGGCVVRTGHTHGALGGHPERSSDRHCHARGGKHDKTVCHTHPHGPGHHN